MKSRDLVFALAIVCVFGLRTAAQADDLKGMGDMDMGGVHTPHGPASPDPSDMKEGEMEAMSGGPEMDHDVHMGHGSMKNMSLQMAYRQCAQRLLPMRIAPTNW
jgi:hypothetical protein